MDTKRTDRTGDVIQKTVAAKVTAVKADGHGTFEALVSVFGNVDSYGDVVLAGAFADTIADRGDKPFPVLWSHQFNDDTAFLGEMSAKETAEGLVVTAEFLDTPRAQNIRRLMEKGLVTEFSWSGRVTEGAWVETEDDFYYEIRKVDLWEAGPCFKGANPATELLSVKSADRALTDAEMSRIVDAVIAAMKADPADTNLPSTEDGTDTTEDPSAASLNPSTKARLALA